MTKESKIFAVGAGCGCAAGVGGTLIAMKVRQKAAQKKIEAATAAMLNGVEQAVQAQGGNFKEV